MGAVIETPAIYLDMSATGNLKEQYRVLGSHGDRYGGFQSVPTGSVPVPRAVDNNAPI